MREQGWRSGERTRLPSSCPGFDSRTRRHMWVEFVVGSLPCSERFFSGFSGFPHSPINKPTFPNSNSIWILVKHFIMSLWLGWSRKHSLCWTLNLHLHLSHLTFYRCAQILCTVTSSSIETPVDVCRTCHESKLIWSNLIMAYNFIQSAAQLEGSRNFLFPR